MERIRLKELKIFGSIVILLVGLAGLLYSYPIVIYADNIDTPIMRLIFYICLASAAVGMLGMLLFSLQREKNKFLNINVIVPTNKKWRLSIKFALTSLTLIATLFVFVNPTPGYASHSFAYNFLFFLPIVVLAFLLCVIGLIIYYSIDKKSRNEIKKRYRIFVHISLLPYIFMVIMLTINLILMPSY